MRGTTYVSTSFRTGFPRTFIKRRGNAAPTLLFVELIKKTYQIHNRTDTKYISSIKKQKAYLVNVDVYIIPNI